MLKEKKSCNGKQNKKFKTIERRLKEKRKEKVVVRSKTIQNNYKRLKEKRKRKVAMGSKFKIK